MRQAAIFDLDGTLCDTSSIVHLVQGEKRDFKAFHAASAQCPAHESVVAAVEAQRAAGRAIVIVTAREFIWRDLSLTWLAEHGIEHDGLYMRVVADYRKDTEVKADILRQVRGEGFDVQEAWDDKPEVVELWQKMGVTAHLAP
jgi:phosphoglycolate phosphatase-like HAD superfamily hydrolase